MRLDNLCPGKFYGAFFMNRTFCLNKRLSMDYGRIS